MAAVLIVAALSACHDDAPAGDTDRLPDELELSFFLKLDDIGNLMSRAGGIWNPDDPTDQGSTFDNTIILKSTKNPDYKWLHVMIINDNGDIAHIDLDDADLWELGNGYYQVYAKLDIADKGWGAGDYRIMVIANYRDRPKDTHVADQLTLSDLFNQFNTGSTVDWFNDSEGARNINYVPYIPMWGIKTISLNLDGKTSANVGEIELLRSVAKVKIELTKELKEAGYKLKSAVTSSWNKKVYPLPAGWNEAAETTDGTTAYDAAFNPNKSRYTDLTVNAPGNNRENDGDDSIVFYLPEWQADKDNPNVTITATVINEVGDEETCQMKIDNNPYDDSTLASKYTAGNKDYSKYNVNRNHLYRFILEKDLIPGKLSYKLECWNYAKSAIGWNPLDNFSFKNDGDNEAKHCYVSFPSYSTKDSETLVQNTTSFADFTFTLTGPEGAVWKAFLIEDGKEYKAEDKFTVNADESITYASAANTPNGFFFGVGNDDKTNTKSVSSGIARPEPYKIKVGSRLSTVSFTDKNPEMEEGSETVIKLNSNGDYWRRKNEVPTCYLVIKIAYDGKVFSEELPINPAGGNDLFKDYEFAGTATRIQIRQLFPFYKNKADRKVGDLIKGIYSTEEIYKNHCWWGYPEGYKNAVNP